MTRLILASNSPRRRQLLRDAGFEFDVIPSVVDESHAGGEPPATLVERLALRKAEDVAQGIPAGDGAVILGADTTVVVNGEILGKPASAEEARAMLEKLSDCVHEVITGVALVPPLGGQTATGAARREVGHEVTKVFFRPLAPKEIADYVATGEPLDKAGAYAIQGRAARFVTRLEGCYFNVMGLPVALVDRLLREWDAG